MQMRQSLLIGMLSQVCGPPLALYNRVGLKTGAE